MNENNASQKVAIVIDTNFIYSYSNILEEMNKKLSENHDVFVCQVSITERISQHCLELQEKYEKLEDIKTKYSDFISITEKISFGDNADLYKKGIQKKYEHQFKDKIIPFEPTLDTFNLLLERVFKKLPPFSAVPNASDKGFKDTLIWLSILNHFKDTEYEEIWLITNDAGFSKNEGDLCKEFEYVVNKKFKVKNNDFYEQYDVEKDETPAIVTPKLLNEEEKKKLRDEINNTIHYICMYDNYYNDYLEKAFETTIRFEVEHIEEIFENMQNVINEHYLQMSIKPSLLWGIMFPLFTIKDIVNIDITNFEKAIVLYDKIKTKHPELLQPFFNAVCEIANRNFVAPDFVPITDEDDELPF